MEDDSKDPSALMGEMDKELTKVKFKSFGKVTVRNDLKTTKELKSLQKKKIELLDNKTNNGQDEDINVLEEKITDEVLSNQRKKLEKEIEELRNMKSKKGKSAVIFHLKDKIVGKKKVSQEATTMVDPKTKEELKSRKEIKEASLSYCVDLLTNRSPKPGFEDDLRLIDLVHEARMNETVENDVQFSKVIFEDSLKELSKKNKQKYEFILKAGKDYKEALFKLCDLVWEAEAKPEQWRKTLIIQLFKGKGERNEFSSQRNIHTKLEVLKLFGHMVMSQSK